MMLCQQNSPGNSGQKRSDTAWAVQMPDESMHGEPHQNFCMKVLAMAGAIDLPMKLAAKV